MNDIQKLESEKRKKLWFISSLAIIALIINSLFLMTSHRYAGPVQYLPAMPPQQSSEMANAAQRAADERKTAEARSAAAEELAAKERKAAQMAAEEHARFLEQHLNTGFARKAGFKTVAFAVACDGKMHHGLDAALVDRFKGESIRMLPSFFTSEFVSDGLFETAFTGSKETFTKLELAKYVDALILAREQVEYSKNPDLENVITATIQLEVTSLSVPGNAVAQTWSFVANGAGFKQPEARALAEERLAKQIAKDTKMSLPP
jgi:hypothetical protein